MKILVPLFFIFLFNACGQNHAPELSEKQSKEYAEKLQNLRKLLIDDKANIDTISDTRFREYLKESRFGIVDSIKIYNAGLYQGFRWSAKFDTISYSPLVIAIPIDAGGFTIVYSTGKMNLNYLHFNINYKARNGGYKYTFREPLENLVSGGLGCGKFYDNDGKQFLCNARLMDIMTIFRISGLTKFDTTYSYVNLTD